jgi:hypothetical protein
MQIAPRTSLVLIALLGIAPSAAVAQAIEAQAFLGSSASLSLPITISQDGEPDLHFTANWATNPRRPTIYYAWRIGLWNGNRGWRLDHTHHKLYLENPPADVQAFRITNGYNIVTLSRAFRQRKLTYSVGAGPVITYPISTIRGKRFDHQGGWDGYFLSGGALLGTVSREFPIVAGLSVVLDARASASYVSVPIADGRAKVPNAALHFHAGLGYRLGKKP